MEALGAAELLRIARRNGFESVIVVTDSMNSVCFVGTNGAAYNPAKALCGPTSCYAELVVEISQMTEVLCASLELCPAFFFCPKSKSATFVSTFRPIFF